MSCPLDFRYWLQRTCNILEDDRDIKSIGRTRANTTHGAKINVDTSTKTIRSVTCKSAKSSQRWGGINLNKTATTVFDFIIIIVVVVHVIRPIYLRVVQALQCYGPSF